MAKCGKASARAAVSSMSLSKQPSSPVRWMDSVPDKLVKKYWPCREDTIPKAVRWFRETHKTPPLVIVSKSKNWRVVQDVWMWSPKALTPGQAYFREMYGKLMGDTKYKEAVQFVMLQMEKERKSGRKSAKRKLD